MSTVLFVCRQNAGRSQMSQALFTRAAGGRHHAISAGTTPATHVHRELAERVDLVITMGCGDQCPVIPGKRYLDWDLPDPAGQPTDQVRAIRDAIADRVTALIAYLDAAG